MNGQWGRALACACLVVVAACSTPAATPGPTTAPSATDEVAALADLDLTIEGHPDFPVAAFGSLWLLRTELDAPNVTRLDPATGAIVAEIPVGDALCQATGVSDDAIWACGSNGVIRIDPGTNRAAGEVKADIGQYYGRLPFGDGSIWAAGGTGVSANTLLRIDPDQLAVADAIPLGFNAGDLAFDFGALWISDPAGGRLVRYDPGSGKLTDHATGLVAPRFLETGFGSIWVGLYDSRDVERPAAGAPTLARIDPSTGATQASIAVGPSPLETCLHAGTAGLWVRSGDPYLALVDPATNAVGKSVRSGNSTGCVVEIGGQVWVMSYELQKVWRLRPGAP